MSATKSLRIAIREGRSMLLSPAGAMIVGTFWLVAGLLLISLLFRFRDGILYLQQTQSATSGPAGLHVNEWVIRPLLYNLGTVLVFFVPLLTMRSFSEERRSGNLELLMSQPLRGADLVVGKFLGSQIALLGCLAVLIPHAIVIEIVSRPDWRAALGGLVGLLLLGNLFGAIGILLSVLSRTQVEAAVLGLGTLLLIVMGPGSLADGGPAFLSILGRFEDFTRGVLDLGHVAFFLGTSLLALALALRGLDVVRWQG